MNLEDAYRRCEVITATEARNFSYGIRLLPPAKRRSMSALYAIARRIDDIGDRDGPGAQRLAELSALRKVLAEVAADPARAVTGSEDPVVVALADTALRCALPMGALDELVEGCEMDVQGVRYESFDDLVGYCRRVAGTIGRLSLAVYGTADRARAEPLADALGVALQLTNILRDVREDRDRMGRVYLPGEDRARFGCDDHLDGPPGALAALVGFEAQRAERWYEEGLPLLAMLDRRSRACTAAMAGIYRRLLRRIQADPGRVARERVSLSGAEKLLVAFGALTRGAA